MENIRGGLRKPEDQSDPPARSRVRGLKLLPGLVVLVAVLMLLGVKGYTGRAAGNIGRGARPTSTPDIALSPTTGMGPLAAPSERERLEVELLTVLPTGFDPNQISRPRGPFVIGVDNRSGLDRLDLKLDDAGGSHLHSATIPKERLDWRKLVDLQPGTYRLTEAGHPSFVCQITLTAN